MGPTPAPLGTSKNPQRSSEPPSTPSLDGGASSLAPPWVQRKAPCGDPRAPSSGASGKHLRGGVCTQDQGLLPTGWELVASWRLGRNAGHLATTQCGPRSRGFEKGGAFGPGMMGRGPGGRLRRRGGAVSFLTVRQSPDDRGPGHAGLTPICHTHHTPFPLRTTREGSPLSQQEHRGWAGWPPGAMGSCRRSRLGVQGHTGGGRRVSDAASALSPLPDTRAFKQQRPWSHRPQFRLSPRAPVGRGCGRSSPTSTPSPLKGWRVTQAVARTSGGLSAGTAAHTWLPGHPGLPPGVAAGPPKNRAELSACLWVGPGCQCGEHTATL